MIYGITTEATDFTGSKVQAWGVRIIRAALFFVPRANPGHEPLYPKVRSWALELDENGWPQREVGLDSSGNPLFGAPDDRNTGFWPDMAEKQFTPAELKPISQAAFNRLWSATQAGA